MAIVNPAYKKDLSEEEEKQLQDDEESNRKLENIEVELEEISLGVKENVGKLMERGEKMESLTKKSEELQSVSVGLKKKAKKIREDSEGGLLKMLADLLGIGKEQVLMGVGALAVAMFLMHAVGFLI